ncbi:MAG: hypothetical protein HY020_18045 [Burkholderiales bacterium]|nr:hypothetical protein [Burkholderiales bacterium]
MKLLPALLLAACASAQAQSEPLTRLAWLAGCWVQPGREAGSVEQWMAPAGGLMLGMSRTLKDGRIVEFEFMQLRAEDGGKLSYVAQLHGRAPTVFPLVKQTEAETVFENPTHDFPQRVLYRLAAPDRLVARIEGTLNGKARALDFPMQRTPCP